VALMLSRVWDFSSKGRLFDEDLERSAMLPVKELKIRTDPEDDRGSMAG
jgi:hypothetical protein